MLDCQRCGIGVRHNLIILAVNDQHRHFDGLQVLGKVGFRKGLDTPITSLDAPHHPLPPPIVNQAIRDVRFRTVHAVAWSNRYNERVLRAVRGETGTVSVEYFDWLAARVRPEGRTS